MRPRWRRALTLGNLARTNEVVFDAHHGAARESPQGFGEDEELTRVTELETELAVIGLRPHRLLRYSHDSLCLHCGLEGSNFLGCHEREVDFRRAAFRDYGGKTGDLHLGVSLTSGTLDFAQE